MSLTLNREALTVAPFAGAWIETLDDLTVDQVSEWSLPLRERGLKHDVEPGQTYQIQVAPFAGAWIETQSTLSGGAPLAHVAPFAGAWIETSRA